MLLYLLPWIFEATWIVVSILAASLSAPTVHTESPGEMACENSMARSALSPLFSLNTLTHFISHSFFHSLSLSYTSKWIPATTDHSHSASSVFIAGARDAAGGAVLGWEMALRCIQLPTRGPTSAKWITSPCPLALLLNHETIPISGF